MAKKKTLDAVPSSAPPTPPAMPNVPMMPGPGPTGMPMGVPPMMPGMSMPMPNVPMMPGMAGMPMTPQAPQGGNPMMMMMQMMQMMMGGGVPPAPIDPSAIPFQSAEAARDQDKGLLADIIRPALLTHRLKNQEPLTLGCVLDVLCLTEDGKYSLGGVPKGCTIAMAGPPGKGKTRSALAGLIRLCRLGLRSALVVAEEGFHNLETSGRDDLCSRLLKIGMNLTGLNEDQLSKQVLENLYVLESQYHRGHTWDDFVSKYRFLIEHEKIQFVVIDSLNMLDPTKNRTADNLSALKTYNHEKGVTCLCIGQIRDTGMPVGGEALQHTADAVFLIEEMSLGSKEIAEMWGGSYREKITVVHAVKSVTTPTFPHPVRVGHDPVTGVMIVHEKQPKEYAVLPPK